jgi:hypothetical protein
MIVEDGVWEIGRIDQFWLNDKFCGVAGKRRGYIIHAEVMYVQAFSLNFDSFEIGGCDISWSTLRRNGAVFESSKVFSFISWATFLTLCLFSIFITFCIVATV